LYILFRYKIDYPPVNSKKAIKNFSSKKKSQSKIRIGGQGQLMVKPSEKVTIHQGITVADLQCSAGTHSSLLPIICSGVFFYRQK
jgi:hypothetical protein